MKQCVRQLFDTLRRSLSSKSGDVSPDAPLGMTSNASLDTTLGRSFIDWRRHVIDSTGLDLVRLASNLKPMARRCGLDPALLDTLTPPKTSDTPKQHDVPKQYDTPDWPELLLFATQTYFAMLVKLLIHRVATGRRSSRNDASRPQQQADTSSAATLSDFFHSLESGDLLTQAAWPTISRNDLFAWYTPFIVTDTELVEILASLIDEMRQVQPGRLLADASSGHDRLAELYQDVLDRKARQALGEFYTPGELADMTLDRLGFAPGDDRRVIDPACGSGTFLIKAIHRIRTEYRHQNRFALNQRSLLPELDVDSIFDRVVGIDLNPIAVLTARASYLLAIGQVGISDVAGREIPVYLADSILDDLQLGQFDYVVGNPPWITWDNLPADYREKTKPYWQRYGLFTLSGNEARHGGGKKDLAMLMIAAASDRWLTDGGRLGMVVTQTMFQTRSSGDGFRRFQLGDDGPMLRVLSVDDLVDLKPFPDASNHTALLTLMKGEPTQYPVPYTRWLNPVVQAREVGQVEPTSRDEPSGPKKSRSWFAQQLADAQQVECCAEPIDVSNPGSPWFVRPKGLNITLSKLTGPSDYDAHLGANTGGANGVFWVELLGESNDGLVKIRNISGREKKKVESVTCLIEPDLLYPLVRWGGIGPYRVNTSSCIILAQDPTTRQGIDLTTMHSHYPATFAYLSRFEPMLIRRAAYRRYQATAPFYSMYNVGPYTVGRHKVAWRRMDNRISAVVLPEIDVPILGRRPLIPQETCVLIDTQSGAESHYLAAVLNSSVVHFLVTSHNVRGGKGFGSPGMLDYLRLRQFDPDDPTHDQLARLSRELHALNEQYGKRSYDTIRETIDQQQRQQQIDRLTAQLWGISPDMAESLARI